MTNSKNFDSSNKILQKCSFQSLSMDTWALRFPLFVLAGYSALLICSPFHSCYLRPCSPPSYPIVWLMKFIFSENNNHQLYHVPPAPGSPTLFLFFLLTLLPTTTICCLFYSSIHNLPVLTACMEEKYKKEEEGMEGHEGEGKPKVFLWWILR